MSVGRAAKPERGDPGRDRSRRHHDDLVPVGAQRGDLVAQLGDRRRVDHARVVGDRRGADLGDDLVIDRPQRSGWYSKLKSPIQTTSPSWAPASGEHLRHAEPFEPVVDVDERLGRGDVVERDDPLDLATDEPELAVGDPLDDGATRLGAQDDDAVAVGSA